MAFLRSRRLRLPLAVVLLLLTQVALAGQACRAVMPGMSDGSGGAAIHQMHTEGGELAATADALPCCEPDPVPLSTCVVPDDASMSAALVADSLQVPDLAAVVELISTDAIRRRDPAPLHPARSAAGPPLLAYIVFHRFLS